MAEPDILIRDTDGDDLAIVHAAQRRRGQPASKLRWTCQHSCAEETIPDCSDFNCEGTLVLDDADARLVLSMAEQGDLAPFEAAILTCRLAAPEHLVAALIAAAPGIARATGAPSKPTAAPPPVELRGSLLAFARCCARIAVGPETVPGLKALGVRLAEKLRTEFWNGGRALLDQRFLDLRAARESRCPLVVFATRGQWPGLAYVAFGTDAGGSTTGYDVAYGLAADKDGAFRFQRVSAGAAREPGDLYGPESRLVLRVDPAAAAEARRIAERRTAEVRADASEACLNCFAAILGALNLNPGEAEASPGEASPWPRVDRFLRRNLDRLPL